MKSKIGERLLPMMIPKHPLPPYRIPGVQTFGWGPNVERDSRGEFGVVGEVVSWILYNNETGSFDVEDMGEGKIDAIKAVLCGEDPSDNFQVLDWANIDAVDLYLNQYDANRELIEKSAFLIGVDISPNTKDSNLENVGPTQRFEFTAKRAIEFVGAEIYLEQFKGDGEKRDFQFKRPSTEFPLAKRRSLIHLLPFDFALKAWVIDKTAGTIRDLGLADCEITAEGVVVKGTVLSETEELFVLHLTDPASEEVTEDVMEPVMVEASALADDQVILMYSEDLDPATVTAGDFSIGGTVPDTATRTGDHEITLDFSVTGGIIMAGQKGVQVQYTQGTLADTAGNLAPAESIVTT